MSINHRRPAPSGVSAWPVIDGLIRGGLAFGIIGLGLGGFATEFLHTPFSPTFQWLWTGAGIGVGLLVGGLWGPRHRD